MRRSPSRPRFLAGLSVLAATAAMLLVPAQQALAKAEPECAAGGVKIKAGASPATVSVNDTTTGTARQVVVTITGTTFAITPVDSAVLLDSATWCLKASTETRDGTGATGISTITNRTGVAQKIGYLVVFGVTSFADPVGTCWDSSVAADLQYIGPINTLGNGYQTGSGGGTCSNGRHEDRTIVRATDAASAANLCLAISGQLTATPLQAMGYATAPADFYICF